MRYMGFRHIARHCKSSHGTQALGARVMQAPWVDSRARFMTPTTPLMLYRRTTIVCVVLVEPCWTTPILPAAANNTDDEGISGGWQGLLWQHRAKPQPLLFAASLS
jgi:hypothetical protein